MKKPWYSITNIAHASEPARVNIYGEIGTGWDGESGVSATEFVEEWNQIPRNQPVDVHIHSPGGSVFDGLAIYNAIAARRNNVTAYVDGVALSAASFIAMAAGSVIMPKTSRLMIHDAQGFSIGDSAHMREMADLLDRESDRIADIYAGKTGRSRKAMRALMQATTWMDGDEALKLGFCDKCTDLAAVSNTFDLSHFRRVPDALKPTATPPPPANSGAETTQDTMKTHIIALLNKHGVKVADDATDDILNAELDKLITAKKVTAAEAAEARKPEPTPDPKNQVDLSKFVSLDQFKAVENQLKAEKDARITARLDAIIANNPDLNRDEWLPRALADEKILDSLTKLKPSTPEPVAFGGPRVTAIKDYLDEIKAKKSTREGSTERLYFIRDNWNDLKNAEMSRLSRLPRNANSTSATVTTSMLNEVVTTVLQNQLAPLNAFGLDVGVDGYKPLATVVSKKITAGGTVQTNATNFEDTTNFVATAGAVSVTVNHYTGGGYLTDSELNSGYRMMDWMVIKTSEFADKLWDVVTALFTTANFTGTPFTAAAAAFSRDDMATIWGLIQKAPTKNLVIEGNYFPKLFGTNTQDYNNELGDVRTVRWPGWATVGYSTRWSAAGANVVGYAGAAQGVRIVAGLPLTSASVVRAGLQQSTLVLPGIGIAVQVNEWGSLANRNDWLTFDSMFGSAVDDGTAGRLIKSA